MGIFFSVFVFAGIFSSFLEEATVVRPVYKYIENKGKIKGAE